MRSKHSANPKDILSDGLQKTRGLPVLRNQPSLSRRNIHHFDKPRNPGMTVAPRRLWTPGEALEEVAYRLKRYVESDIISDDDALRWGIVADAI